MCKPQLGLTLTSIAARFCQTLGYNRLTPVDGDNDPERQRKILMFWQVYIYGTALRVTTRACSWLTCFPDRNTSLRVGRPPSIPEYDVSTECLDQISRFSQYLPPVIHCHRYWAHVADVQGAISSKLYSPVGLRQSVDQRTRLVKALVAKLQSAWNLRRQVGILACN